MNMPEFPESSSQSEKFTDNGEQITHDWTVEALIVAINRDSEARYVITKVLEGHDNVYDSFYKHVTSAQSDFLLAPEDNIANYSYRALQDSEGYYRRVEDEHEYSPYLDVLLSDTPVAIGDRVNIARWTRKVPQDSRRTSWKLQYSDVVTALESGVNIREEEDRNLERRTYLRHNFAAILHRLEQLQLAQRERLQPNSDTAINWVHNKERDTFRAEFVYGNEPIKDHFVTVRAEPAAVQKIPLGGEMRFTYSGRAFLAREIYAGQMSKELVIRDEPLLELSAIIHTETEFNPEVNDVRVDFIIDNIRYTGVLDIDLSTRSFRHPGHHLHFESFAVAGEEFDGIEISEADRDTIHELEGELRRLRMRAESISTDEVAAFKGIAGNTASESVALADRELHEIKLAAESLSARMKPVIGRIKAAPSDVKLGVGGKLLVPQSKLGDVRVIIGQKGDGLGE
ncbi:TPA: hypothetical protein DD425_03475 [Candidatus Saccharibacteria bacterium]|nr:hypothetical protein [Candidatus Saccharibacteria bacterium]|tara:strand:+ start:2346 stop:3713 length:1368 start_codon:yes stop_codon:yes gene_type:complete